MGGLLGLGASTGSGGESLDCIGVFGGSGDDVQNRLQSLDDDENLDDDDDETGDKDDDDKNNNNNGSNDGGLSGEEEVVLGDEDYQMDFVDQDANNFGEMEEGGGSAYDD